jgi:signal transduction histidine kinase
MTEAGRLFSSSLQLDATLRNIGTLSVGWIADWCLIDLLADDGSLSRVEVATADSAEATLAQAFRDFPLDPRQPSLFFAATRSRQPVLVPCVSDEHLEDIAQGPEHLGLLRRLRPSAYIAIPLLDEDRLLGCLFFIRTTGCYSLNELRTAGDIAALAAQAIVNARTHEASEHALSHFDDVAAMVAHDLRSPISSIVFATSLLKLRLQEAGIAGLDPLIDGIFHTADHMTRLVGDLLEAHRLKTAHLPMRPEPVAVRGIFDSAIADFHGPAATAGITLSATVDDDAVDVMADPSRIYQVLSNLIGNAIRFTPAGGTIHMTARRHGTTVRVSVDDSGCGIAAADLHRVFEPFWRGQAHPHKGLGLGLSIARSIVELHGGTLAVDSQPERGSSFSFTLPALPGTRPAP